MSLFARRFPGGLFPRLVALFPLLFPFYLVQGVLLGVPVTLPEMFLSAMAFYFLFEHDSFRLGEWRLWSVLAFFLMALLIAFAGPFDTFVFLKSGVLFPLVYFIVARNVFREKPSMLLLTQRALLLSVSFLALAEGFSSTVGVFGTEEALGLLFGPSLVLAAFTGFHSKSRFDQFLALFSGLLCFSTLLLEGSYWILTVAFFVGALQGVFHLKKKGQKGFTLACLLWMGLLVLSAFFLSEHGSLPFILPEGLLLHPLALSLYGVLTCILLWMGSQALPWLVERDSQRRFAVAHALLCFLILIGFALPSLNVGHFYLFWLFMAILL